MQFQLPSNLQTELISYDPVLKKLAQPKKAASSSKKAKYPLGNPVDLIPEEIVTKNDLQAGIDHINQSLARDRHYPFTRLVGNKQQTYAILYHYEGVWVAAWLPPASKKNDYVYGYTYCFKDTASNQKMLGYLIKKNIETYTTTEIGRSIYRSNTRFITKDCIRGKFGDDVKYWHYSNIHSWSAKGSHIAQTIKLFEESLKETIPCWKDSMTFFDRIRHSNDLNGLLTERFARWEDSYWQKYTDDFGLDKEQWTPSFNAILHYLDYIDCKVSVSAYADALKIRHILNTPFFRKWIQAKCDEINQKFADEKTEYLAEVKRPWLLIFELVKAIRYVDYIWGSAVPVDYYQSNIDNLLGIRSVYRIDSLARDWLSSNMTPASYFHIRSKYYLEKMEKVNAEGANTARWDFENTLNIYQFRFNDWDDTCSMINTIIGAGKTIDPPKRWRITEFHDHVQAEAWKIKNPNHSLPQDLFPSPVKVETEGETWTFFQPLDTHQLSQWGQAVRNCVGNATNYAEGVRKKQHFIVLCLVDSKPVFTVQLQVRNGMMSVDQIVAFANKTLSQQEKERYTAAFAAALQEQENRLKSGAVAA